MATLSELIQQESFYRAGGKPEGGRDIDKIQGIFNTIKETGGLLQTIAKQHLEDRVKKMQLQRAEKESMPISQRFPVKPKGEVLTSPTGDMLTSPAGDIQTATGEDMFAGIPRSATLGEAKDIADIQKTQREKTALDQTPMIVDATWSKITGLPVGTPGTYGQFKQAASLKRSETLATGIGTRQEKAQTFRSELEIKKELMRIGSEERSVKRQEVKEIRPKVNDLKKQLKLGEQIKNDLRVAIDSGVDVTGLLSAPLNTVKEILGVLPEDQQRLLTRLRLNFADFVRERGGTAFTATEKEVFSPIVPEEKVDELTNYNRINGMLDIMNDRLGIYQTDYPQAFENNFLQPTSKGNLGGSSNINKSTTAFTTKLGNTFEIKEIP